MRASFTAVAAELAWVRARVASDACEGAAESRLGSGSGPHLAYRDLQIVRAYYAKSKDERHNAAKARHGEQWFGSTGEQQQPGRRPGAGSRQGADGDLPGAWQRADGNGEEGNTLRIP